MSPAAPPRSLNRTGVLARARALTPPERVRVARWCAVRAAAVTELTYAYLAAAPRVWRAGGARSRAVELVRSWELPDGLAAPAGAALGLAAAANASRPALDAADLARFLGPASEALELTAWLRRRADPALERVVDRLLAGPWSGTLGQLQDTASAVRAA